MRELIDQHFNDSELRSLCFDLDVDYDGLPGETKSDKSRELIAYCKRHGRIRDLMTELKQQRKYVPRDEASVYSTTPAGEGPKLGAALHKSESKQDLVRETRHV